MTPTQILLPSLDSSLINLLPPSFLTRLTWVSFNVAEYGKSLVTPRPQDKLSGAPTLPAFPHQLLLLLQLSV